MPQIDVLEVIKDKMQEQVIKNKDLEGIIGSKSHVPPFFLAEEI
ncbi:hypothetical protein [Pelobium manganitolerans]